MAEPEIKEAILSTETLVGSLGDLDQVLHKSAKSWAETRLATKEVTKTYGDLGEIYAKILDQFSKGEKIDKRLIVGYRAHFRAIQNIEKEMVRVEKMTKMLNLASMKWYQLLGKAGGAIAGATMGLGRQVAQVAGLSLGYKELSDALLRYNRNMFTTTRIGGLYGESLKDVRRGMDLAHKTTTLAQEDFLRLATSIKKVYVGIPPTTEEIGRFASELQKRFGYSVEATEEALNNLMAVQQRMPDVMDRMRDGWDAYSRSAGEGGAATTSMTLRMEALGFSAGEIRDAMTAIKPPDMESGSLLKFEKRLSENIKRQKDSQRQIAQDFEPTLRALSDAFAKASELATKVSGVIKELGAGFQTAAAYLSVFNTLGGIVFLMNMRKWYSNARLFAKLKWSGGLPGIEQAAAGGGMAARAAGGVPDFVARGVAARAAGGGMAARAAGGVPGFVARGVAARAAGGGMAARAAGIFGGGTLLGSLALLGSAVGMAKGGMKHQRYVQRQEGEGKWDFFKSRSKENITALSKSKYNPLGNVLGGAGAKIWEMMVGPQKEVGKMSKEFEGDQAKYNKALKSTLDISADWSTYANNIRDASNRTLKVMELTSQVIDEIRGGLPTVAKGMAEIGTLTGKPLEFALRVDVVAAEQDVTRALNNWRINAAKSMGQMRSLMEKGTMSGASEGFKSIVKQSAAFKAEADAVEEVEGKLHRLKEQQKTLEVGSKAFKETEDQIAELEAKLKPLHQKLSEAMKPSSEVVRDTTIMFEEVQAAIARTDEAKGKAMAVGDLGTFATLEKEADVLQTRLLAIKDTLNGYGETLAMVGKRSQASLNAILKPMEAQLHHQKSIVRYSRTAMETAEEANLGLSKSYELRLAYVESLEKEKKLLEDANGLIMQELKSDFKGKQVKLDQNALLSDSVGYTEALLKNGTIDEDLKIRMLTYADQYRDNQTRTLEITKESLAATKSMREGYLDAMTEMVANAGDFAAVIGTQETGVTQLIAAGARSTFKYGGVMEKGAKGVREKAVGWSASGGLRPENMEVLGGRQKRATELKGYAEFDLQREVKQKTDAMRKGLATGAVKQGEAVGGSTEKQMENYMKSGVFVGGARVSPGKAEKGDLATAAAATAAMIPFNAGKGVGAKQATTGRMGIPTSRSVRSIEGGILSSVPAEGGSAKGESIVSVRIDLSPDASRLFTAKTTESTDVRTQPAD